MATLLHSCTFREFDGDPSVFLHSRKLTVSDPSWAFILAPLEIDGDPPFCVLAFSTKADGDQFSVLAFSKADGQFSVLAFSKADCDQFSVLAFLKADGDQFSVLAFLKADGDQFSVLAFSKADGDQFSVLAFSKADGDQFSVLAFSTKADGDQFSVLAFSKADGDQFSVLAFSKADGDQFSVLAFSKAADDQFCVLAPPEAGTEPCVSGVDRMLGHYVAPVCQVSATKEVYSLSCHRGRLCCACCAGPLHAGPGSALRLATRDTTST